MKDLVVDVKLWGQNVGSLYWDKNLGVALFDYDTPF